MEFREYISEEKIKPEFKTGDVIRNHLGKDKFTDITIKDIKGKFYITSNGKIEIKFQDSYKLK